MADTTTERLAQTERALAEAFCTGLSAAVEGITGSRPRASVRAVADGDVETSATPTADYWWQQRLSLSEYAFAWVGAPAESWEGLGKHTLAAAGIEDAETADVLQTYQELLQQGLSALAQVIGSRIGEEVTCEEGQESGEPAETLSLPLEVEYTEGAPQTLWVSFSPALLAGLRKGAAAEESKPQPAPRPKALTGVLESGSEAMALLLDVELPVSISFGRTHLPIKDVMKLASGSIVELNRAVSEPVEVIVNNCVIARGEVVVVDGNYGVRILQIISRRERLRTLN